MADMDEIDDLMRRSAPPALGSDPKNAAEARLIARAVATERRPPRSRLRTGLGAAILTVGLVGVGTTAAVAGPTLLGWVGWVPDASVQRTFELDAGSEIGFCAVVARVVPEYGGGLSDTEVDGRTEEAREFLADYDWGPVVASISPEDIGAALRAEQAEREASEERTGGGGGALTDVPDADHGVVVSSLMGDEMMRVFEEAGYLDGGVSLDMAGECGAETPGGAA